MYGKMQAHLASELNTIREAGLYKQERLIATQQQAEIKVSTGEEVLNFCANNYLGLSNDPRGESHDGPSRIRDVLRTFHLRHAGHPS